MHLIDIQRSTTAKNGVFQLHVIGDMHADRVEFDEERFKEHVKVIAKSPNPVCIVIGDLLDGRIPGRKHFDPDTVRLDFLSNLKSYVNHGLDVLDGYFKPLIKAKVPTVFVVGNHDEYLEEIGLTSAIVTRLAAYGRNVHYLGGEGFIRVQTGHGNSPNGGARTTVIYSRHGSGGGKRPGPKVNQMQAEFEWIDADIIVQGHVHDGDIRVIDAHTVTKSGDPHLQIKKRAMFRAPGYVRRAVEGRVGYQGKKGYPATDTGLMYLNVDPSKNRITRHELEI